MPVDVKSYLESMKSVSSSVKVEQKTTDQNDLKMQLLLSQLIEALSYANSMNFRPKTLNKKDVKEEQTGQEILDTMKAQEGLVKQLAAGQKLSDEQSKKLTEAIDKFYEMAGATEVNYKKFAENLEKFGLRDDLPEAVKTRVINDSRDAHMIGQEQKNAEKNPIFTILKKIKYALEDAGEATKQYRKKLFVTLDQFREGFLEGLQELADKLSSKSIGDWISEIMKNLQLAGMAWMGLQDMFARGDFKWGQALKQINNIKDAFKAFKSVAKSATKIKGPIKAIKDMITGVRIIGKNIASIPKLISKLGFGKGFGKAMGGIGKGLAKGFGKGVLKKIPLIGTLLSVWMGIERWKKKDYTGALIEFASGVAAMFPGIGTLVSIGLDLVNFGRDTKAFKAIGEKMEAKIPNLKENALLSIPIVGQMFGLKKTIEIWKSGDKAGALKMFAKTWSSVMPGGAWIFDLMDTIFKTKFSQPKEEPGKEPKGDNSPSPGSNDAGGGRKKWWQFGKKEVKGDKDFGDAPIKWQNESGGYSSRGLTNNALKATENFNKLVGGGLTVTSAFRDPAKMMPLWNEAKPIPGSRNRINRYGNEMADPRRSNHAKGLAVDVPKGLYNRMGSGKFANLAKQAGFKLVYPEYSAVHLEVGNGGKVAEVKNPKKDKKGGKVTGAEPSIFEPISEDQTSIAQAGEQQENGTMSFEDIMAKFTQYNENMLNDPALAGVNKVYAQAENSMKAPSMESLTGTQMPQSQPSAPAPQTKQPVQQQTVQTVQAPAPPATMDTGIDDTALALLNSVLFK